MKLEEYRQKVQEENKRHTKQMSSIMKDFAFSNSKVKIGDIIKSDYGPIVVEEIHYTKAYMNDFPECVYKGVKVTKKGEPFKSGEKDMIYQSRIIEDK